MMVPHVLRNPLHVPMWGPKHLGLQPPIRTPQGHGHPNPRVSQVTPIPTLHLGSLHIPPTQDGEKLHALVCAGDTLGWQCSVGSVLQPG